MGSMVATECRGRVAVARIDRPEARNALSVELMEELAGALESLDTDPEIRCIVVAGSERVFASGADIRGLAERDLAETLHSPSVRFWPRIAAIGTPTVAAVSGWALGGGCELALACDMIVAAEDAELGQPEITLGIIPGGGGTQRLTRVLGKQRAMELVLTGRRINAAEAHRLGLVNVVAPPGEWLERAVELAEEIAARAPIAARLAKQAVLAADQGPLEAGLATERRLFELSMATSDRVEGTRAFLEGREPRFEGR
jgi:enoyl-CoA hydratase/carnithine racemase